MTGSARSGFVERYPGLDGEAEIWLLDAVSACEKLRAAGDAVALAYLDPPFAVGKTFPLSLRVQDEDVARPEPRVAYDDRWEDGLDGYLDFMRTVLIAVRDALADDGSLLLHCDHRASPYLAVLCDELFGLGDRTGTGQAPGFRNQLIWRYGLGGSSNRSYPKKHDTILWYTRSDRWHFEPPLVPATSRRMQGELKKAPDVLDVPAINNQAHERTGYPTQKPLALLELLVRAHTEPGQLVFDPFCGSGTTAVAAARTGRRAVVSDRSPDAVAVARSRLVAERASVSIWRPGRPEPAPASALAWHRVAEGIVIEPGLRGVVFAATGELDAGGGSFRAGDAWSGLARGGRPCLADGRFLLVWGGDGVTTLTPLDR